MTEKDLRRIKRLKQGKPVTLARRRRLIEKIGRLVWEGTPPEERADMVMFMMGIGAALTAIQTGNDRIITLLPTDNLAQLIDKINETAAANGVHVDDVVTSLLARLTSTPSGAN